ncbi:MAG: thiamine phosphate synthase [Bryobacteraceae bacterium]
MTLPPVYPLLDTAALTRTRSCLRDAAQALIEGGAGILQLRHNGHWSRAFYEEAAWIGERCRAQGIMWVVNDRADAAAILRAGLHVGQDDLPPNLVRALIGDQIIGFSTHNASQLEAADETADYLALGPIFGTQSKENPDPVVGTDNLRRWRKLTAKPLVAIGGITREAAPEVWEAGADSVAVIGDLYPEGASSTRIRERMEAWRRLARN